MSMSYFEQADKQFVKAIQKGIGAKVDGYFGEESLFKTALMFKSIGKVELDTPLCTKMYGGYLIYADRNDLKIDFANMKRATRHHKYAVNGVFFWNSKPVSVLISDDKVYNNTSSKQWQDKAEGCIYLDLNNKLHFEKTKVFDKKVKWAISGVTLHDYHPDWEGYTGKFSDVLRYTYHTVIGVTQDDMIIAFTKKANAKTLVNDVKYNLNLKWAVMLDGGSLGSINTPKFKYNSNKLQNNMIYFE